MNLYARRMTEMAGECGKCKSLTNSLTAQNMISFAAGAPAREAYPFDCLREISKDVFQNNALGLEALKYGGALGALEMRKAVRDWLLVPRGLNAGLEKT